MYKEMVYRSVVYFGFIINSEFGVAPYLSDIYFNQLGFFSLYVTLVKVSIEVTQVENLFHLVVERGEEF